MRPGTLVIRAILGACLALALTMHLLSPAGFMPAFDHGAVTIVVCPDYEAGAAHHHHHHRSPKKPQQQCPYAGGAAAGTLAGIFLVVSVMLFGAALLIDRTFRFVQSHRRHDRPPARGPPQPA